jgi:hypothetical protein
MFFEKTFLILKIIYSICKLLFILYKKSNRDIVIIKMKYKMKI